MLFLLIGYIDSPLTTVARGTRPLDLSFGQGRYSFAGSKIDAFTSFRHLDNFLNGGLGGGQGVGGGGGTGSDLKWRDDDREKNKHNTNHIRRSGRR